MSFRLALAGSALTAVIAASAPAQAQAQTHPHPPGTAHAPAMAHAPGHAHTADETQVRGVVTAYKDAIIRMDVSQTPALFWDDSAIFENGGVEGTFAYYLEHHLGPEFSDLAGFEFRNHEMTVEIDGDTAFVSETYTYHITFKDTTREPIERRGVATSVLRKRGNEWRFDIYHSSARPLRRAA